MKGMLQSIVKKMQSDPEETWGKLTVSIQEFVDKQKSLGHGLRRKEDEEEQKGRKTKNTSCRKVLSQRHNRRILSTVQQKAP